MSWNYNIFSAFIVPFFISYISTISNFYKLMNFENIKSFSIFFSIVLSLELWRHKEAYIHIPASYNKNYNITKTIKLPYI